MSEQELDETQGQAFISLDQYSQTNTPTNTTIDFTRVNLGMNIEIFSNADEVVFGEYDRYVNGDLESQTADIRFENYAMGYIDQYGEVKTFQMNDPFFELAYEGDDFVGFRFGFGEAAGMMSMNAKSLTGNASVEISGDFTPFPDIAILDGIVLDATGRSSLVTPAGIPDDIRSTHIGIPNGDVFTINDWFLNNILGLHEIPVNNCIASALGNESPMCFPLNTFESMLIGDPDGNPVPGLFQSFQTKNVEWGNKSAGEDIVTTIPGAFFNIPNGAVNVTPDEAAAGTPRVATEFIDRGIGRFVDPRYGNGITWPE
jgi:hypothetical protein